VALAATIQALEVQKMTLATLKGMNFNMGEVADALKLKMPPDRPAGGARPEPANAAATGAPAADQPEPARQRRKAKDEPAAPVVDPLQWWGALTQQFQQIATNAMQDAAAAAAAAPAAPAMGGAGQRGSATGAGGGRKKAAAAKRSTRKAAAR
jgi:hypothetical protein